VTQFKVVYPQTTRKVVEPRILTKAITESTESIDKAEPRILTKAASECSESIDKIEPIFELGGGEIYELE
jgi:hypothetical protein